MKDIESRLHKDLAGTLGPLPEGAETPLYTLAEIRKRAQVMREGYRAKAVNVPEVAVTEETITSDGRDMVIRLYQPAEGETPRTGVLLLHGGGLVYGAPEMHEETAVQIVQRTGALVAAPDYALAADAPYPAALRDCYAALEWLDGHLQGAGRRLAVMGISAGGGLAVATALWARDHQGPRIDFVMPLWPMLDHRADSPSNQAIQDPRVWNGLTNRHHWQIYLREVMGAVPGYASPAVAEDLSGLPPMYISLGQLDPFLDENLAFVSRLSEAGVPVEFHLYPGAYHGFSLLQPQTELSQRCNREWLEALAAIVGSGRQE